MIEKWKAQKKYRENNKKKVNDCAAKSARKKLQEIRNEILKLLGNKCLVCGFIDQRALHIDHVNSGGRQERKRFVNYLMYLEYVLTQIKSGSKDYQLLCANHNAIKRYENKECPTLHDL